MGRAGKCPRADIRDEHARSQKPPSHLKATCKIVGRVPIQFPEYKPNCSNKQKIENNRAVVVNAHSANDSPLNQERSLTSRQFQAIILEAAKPRQPNGPQFSTHAVRPASHVHCDLFALQPYPPLPIRPIRIAGRFPPYRQI